RQGEPCETKDGVYSPFVQYLALVTSNSRDKGQVVIIPPALVADRGPRTDITMFHGLWIRLPHRIPRLLELAPDLAEVRDVALDRKPFLFRPAPKHYVHPLRLDPLDSCYQV